MAGAVQPPLPQQPEPQQQQASLMSTIGSILRTVLIFQVIRYFLFPSPASVQPTIDPVTSLPTMSRPHSPLWTANQVFDLRVYASPDPEFTDFATATPLWLESDVVFNDAAYRAKNITIPTPKLLLENGTLYVHTFVTKKNFSPNPKAANYQRVGTAYKRSTLNVYKPKPKIHARKKLLSGEYTDSRLQIEDSNSASASDTAAAIDAQTAAPPEWISFWRPTLHLRLLYDFTTFPANGIPPPLNLQFDIDPSTSHYYPVVVYDFFWLLQERLIQINESTPELPLELIYSPISLLKLQFQLQMEETWKMQQSFGSSEDETQEFKRMFLETNPILLGVTLAVSMLHMIFDFLAFKNDIQFWSSERSMEGLSVRSILLNAFCQVIIFLYLFDNDTSWMILLSSFVGLFIEFWKIHKAMNVSFDRTKRFWVRFENKQSYEASGTAKFDEDAMRYLSWVLYPCVVGYAIYSLYYNDHKGWYSWLLGSLTGAVYTFGFIMMTPQLYLNYKLKSVAHLPWRMLTYKALNTFIDDLFAFIIKMPTMHRLSCFRDDIIFFIYLYQRWIYRVDFSRTNEFGLRVADAAADDVGAEMQAQLKRLPVDTRQLIRDYVGPLPAADADEAATAAAAVPSASSAAASVTTSIGKPSAAESSSGLRKRAR